MNKTKYYVNLNGDYIGSFGFPYNPPTGAIEVPFAPAHGLQKWNGTDFDPFTLPVVNDPLTAEELFDMLKAKNIVRDNDRPRPKPQGVTP